MAFFFRCSNFIHLDPRAFPLVLLRPSVASHESFLTNRTPSDAQNKHVSFTQRRVSCWLARTLCSPAGWFAPGAGRPAGPWLIWNGPLVVTRNSAVLHVYFSSWGPKPGPDMLVPQPWHTSQTGQVLPGCLLAPLPVTIQGTDWSHLQGEELAKLDEKAESWMG